MRRGCERIERELKKMIEAIKHITRYTFSDPAAMCVDLGRAVSQLQRFRQDAEQVPSRRESLEFRRNKLRAFWMFQPPAIAYALFRLLTEYSEPRLLKRHAYSIIGTFEREYLGRMSRSADSDPEDTVRRQVYIFSRSPNRKPMDRILKRLLAGKWYCLDHPLNCDWETPKTHPHPSP
jgi:hypothetical protein